VVNKQINRVQSRKKRIFMYLYPLLLSHENIHVRWRRSKSGERVDDYLIKNLTSSSNRPFYVDQIEAFLQMDRENKKVEVELPPQEEMQLPETFQPKKLRNADQQMQNAQSVMVHPKKKNGITDALQFLPNKNERNYT
jgi:hypothetical protein